MKILNQIMSESTLLQRGKLFEMNIIKHWKPVTTLLNQHLLGNVMMNWEQIRTNPISMCFKVMRFFFYSFIISALIYKAATLCSFAMQYLRNYFQKTKNFFSHQKPAKNNDSIVSQDPSSSKDTIDTAKTQKYKNTKGLISSIVNSVYNLVFIESLEEKFQKLKNAYAEYNALQDEISNFLISYEATSNNAIAESWRLKDTTAYFENYDEFQEKITKLNKAIWFYETFYLAENTSYSPSEIHQITQQATVHHEYVLSLYHDYLDELEKRLRVNNDPSVPTESKKYKKN